MASSLNRTAIILDLVAFLGLSVFCIGTQPSIIQQDILKKCQDTLLSDRIPVNGLSVDGRDVLLTGPAGSAIVSPRAYSILSEVSGVREVATHVVSGRSASPPSAVNALPPAAPTSVNPDAQLNLQEKIDRILDNQSISFKPDTVTLTPEGESALDKVAAYLVAAPAVSCEIRGYDTQPGESHQNWVLALQRAMATQDYLEIKGVSDFRLSTRAFHVGEASDGRRSDRPVDLVVKARE